MTGTIVNIIAILLGTFLGLVLGKRISEQIRSTIITAIGIFTLFLGVQMFLGVNNSIATLLGLVLGTLIGELLKIEEALERLGSWLQSLATKTLGDGVSNDKQKFIQAFLTATMLFIVGPASILGSIQDGLSGDSEMLIIKSILDGVSSIVFASTLGIGIAFSIVPLFLYQGTITLLAEQAQAIMNDAMIADMTAAGGVLLGAIAISSLLNIKKIRVSSMIPALFVTPFLVWLMQILNISF